MESAHPNPAYSVVPRLVRIPAAEWSDAPRSPLYLKLLLEPSSFEWLSEAGCYPDCFPELWARYGSERAPNNSGS